MVAQPNLPGRRLATGHEASAAPARAAAAEPDQVVQAAAEVAAEAGAEVGAAVGAAVAPADGNAVPLPETPPSSVAPTPGGLPRWLLLLLGGATATIAVAGLREIS